MVIAQPGAPAQVEVEGQTFTVEAPGWFAWQGVLERAVRPDGQVDAQKLLEEALLVSVQDDQQQRIRRNDLQALSSQSGDRLLSTVVGLMESQRQGLNLEVEAGDPPSIRGANLRLNLRAWSFGERNDALRKALKVTPGGQVALDLTTYERVMVLQCVTADGARLEPSELSAWPVPLGELVLNTLDQLNGIEPTYSETLIACLRTGTEHPDLSLMQLCLTFGWAPEQVLRLDAQLAERMLIAIRESQPHGGGPTTGPLPPATMGTPVVSTIETLPLIPPNYVAEGVKRIFVTKD